VTALGSGAKGTDVTREKAWISLWQVHSSGEDGPAEKGERRAPWLTPVIPATRRQRSGGSRMEASPIFK
jgi:hypothetical protein